jgi:hypothetical protein
VFTVEWLDIATMELAARMREASPELRRAIGQAIRQVDITSAYNPDQLGESRGPGTRIICIDPLVLQFSVNVRLQKVLILELRIPKRRLR